jgi:hypothetical protein
MSNTVAEFQSAPIPASAQPTNTMTQAEKYDEKEAVFNGESDVVVGHVNHRDEYESDEVEPTDEEFATLRK